LGFELLVVVADNPDKVYDTSGEDRADYFWEEVSHLHNTQVTYRKDSDLGDYLKSENVEVVVRGLRDTKDFEYEQAMTRHAQQVWGVDVMYLPCPESLCCISSTGIRGN